jgi:transposase
MGAPSAKGQIGRVNAAFRRRLRYDSNTIREAVAALGGWANIPNRSNRKQRYGFSSWLYRQRNLVERFFNRIKQYRGIATRYDKDPANFMAAVKLICTRIWCAA